MMLVPAARAPVAMLAVVRAIPVGAMLILDPAVPKLVASHGLAVAVTRDDVIPAVVLSGGVRQEKAFFDRA